VVTQPPMLRGLRLFAPSAGFLALFSLLVPACKQGSGERCEIDSDCSSGLTCQMNSTNTSQHDGVCGNTTALPAVDAAVVDAASPVDVPPADLAPDVSSETGPDTGPDTTPDVSPDTTPDSSPPDTTVDRPASDTPTAG
jgi:hypothetical protein